MLRVLIRSMSSTSLAHNPPIPIFGIEGRYVSALYSAAHKMQQLDEVEKHLQSLNKLLLKPKVMDFIESSLMSTVAKATLLREIGKETVLLWEHKTYSTKALGRQYIFCHNTTSWTNDAHLFGFHSPSYGTAASSLPAFIFPKKGFYATTGMPEAAINFLGVVAENNRLKKLRKMINMFLTVMGAHRNEALCEVITAKPLDKSSRESLMSALKKFVKDDKKIQLTEKIDPSIIGGMIVGIEDKHIDLSIARKIKMYTDILKEAL